MTIITIDEASKLAQAIAPLLALFALIFTIRSGVQNKRADIMMECHRRFDALASLRLDLTKRLRATNLQIPDLDLEDDINSWVQRFWSLQFDEYEFWRRGFIDNDFFRYWMSSRHREFEKARVDKQHNPPHRTFEVIVFMEGFDRISQTWADASSPSNGDFKQFMEYVRKNQIDHAMKKHGPWFLRQWGLWG